MSGEAETPNVIAAAKWIADRHEKQEGRIIPAIRSTFSLTMAEACQACALASRFRGNREGMTNA